ncbi:tyrosine-type recombinase/integrase [Enterococcus dongliensis]|uniref:tyrosine-type recombinase/integrase n=1 Tax=Enterococcus dongliensis TaxID=2559925 RepID=UPI00288E540A|nr:tyrosine-type recombinase/integrase [Enterococcus dongliensis]MDT2643394.1 tyrosine-type recombinase/integrase [Enterococcus dongliensis]
MRVQEVIINNGGKRYLVLDDQEKPIQTVLHYMKYLDNIQKSPNTQRTYCYALRDYFVFLSLTETDFETASIKTIANFLSWLVNPTLIEKVQHVIPPSLKSEKTINLKVTAVLSFYKFLYQFEYIEQDVANRAYVDVKGIKQYKGFLHHITRSKSVSESILKLKEPKKRVEIIPDATLKAALSATTNVRDFFLLQLLFETGLRIGETLSLHKEDILFDLQRGHRIHLTCRNDQTRESRQKTGLREVHISASLIDLFDDYMYSIADFDQCDSLFVKIKGKSKGLPMNYQDVISTFKRLEQKIDYHLHPHLYRHTHATKYYEQTKDIKIVQERLGHKQIQTTMNLYLHPTDEKIRTQWEKASPAFRMEE